MLNAEPGLLSDFDIFNCYTRFHPDATSHLPQIKEISKKNFTSTSHAAAYCKTLTAFQRVPAPGYGC